MIIRTGMRQFLREPWKNQARSSRWIWALFFAVSCAGELVAPELWAASHQAKWEKVLKAARDEGKVTVLGPRPAPVRPAVIGAFQKAFPDIAIEFQPGSLGRSAARLRAELGKGKTSMDLAITGTSVLRNKDLFEPVPPRLILPAVLDRETWRSARGKGFRWADKEGQLALQTSEWVFGYIVVNTKMVDPASLTSWKELLKPKWKGKIASHDPRGGGAGQEIASYLLVKFGDKFITDLYKGQEVVLTRSYSQIADWLAQGKYAIGIAQVPDRIEALKSEGVPLKAFSIADAPGTLTGGTSVLAVLKGASHPNAATVFLNWILTKEGQEALHRPQLYPSLRTDVSRDYLPDYIVPKSGAEYLDTYTEEFQKRRRKLTNQVKELVGR